MRRRAGLILMIKGPVKNHAVKELISSPSKHHTAKERAADGIPVQVHQ